MEEPVRRKARKGEAAQNTALSEPAPQLLWLRATYAFHTFAYRDPRAAFSSAVGLPVVSPTTVLLGIVSSLFSLGDSEGAQRVLSTAHLCKVAVDPPAGVIFFRAFHQQRRYYSTRKGATHRAGLTNISQGTREYGLPEGTMSLYVGVPASILDAAKHALQNRDHLGTHDSLCSLVGEVMPCNEPSDVLYWPRNVGRARCPAKRASRSSPSRGFGRGP